jgi:archaellin
MKSLLLLSTLALPLSAQLRITEVMSDSLHSTTGANGDWFEITNTGASAENIGGYSFDDSPPVPRRAGQIFPSYSIPAGASIIVLDESSATEFRALWNIPASVKIFTSAELTSFPGLSSAGDSVFLFNASNSVASEYAFGSSTAGASFARFTNGNSVPGGLSVNGLFGAYRSNDSSEDTGSPGTAAATPAPLPPIFIAPFSNTWISGNPLSNSEFRVRAVDPNPGDVVTLTATSKPAWLTFTDLGGGFAQFSGTATAAEVGTHQITVQAADNSGLTTPSEKTYSLYIAPATSPVILNEYNAVANSQFIGGGAQADVGAPTDPTLGRIAGNGGAWLEFVVTGSAGSQSVDLRNWTIKVDGNDKTRILKLSNHTSLSAVPNGTILTFTDDRATSDTALPKLSNKISGGFQWSNIWMFDPILIDQTASIHPGGRTIGTSDTRVTLSDGTGQIVYGPIGESILAKDNNLNGFPDELLSVSDTEVLKLEANPTSSVSPIAVTYDDGDTSTFGRPNVWNSNLTTQSFTPFATANTPPVFGPAPRRVSVRGIYSVSVTATDPGAKPITFTALQLPSFLTLTPSANSITIVNNRPLTAADTGKYEITIQADNGGAANNLAYLVYQLDVQNPAPSVILNEYNAVLNTTGDPLNPPEYLNGGTLTTDSDGGVASTDSHFGRVLGNGGDWLELVVVGNGTAGFSNLTGWTIEVGNSPVTDVFNPITTITLTDPAAWSNVGNGTILTFIENNTAAGGLDTQLNRVNQLTTTGYAWTNIHLGTPDYISVTNLAGFEIDSDNTQIVIKDASGTIVFGPAGEGVAPPSGIGKTEILELENDPSPLVSTTDDADDFTLGYDDGSSGSTFGSANLFDPPGGIVADRAQDFSPFILSPFEAYLASVGLPGANAQGDDDQDGHSNLDEYLLGGNPNDPASAPVIAIDVTSGTGTANVRISDPAYSVIAQRSADLQNWITTDISTGDTASPLGANFVTRTLTYSGIADKMFFRFATPTEP